LLAAHKIAPAMACGATITLKPPPQDPLTTLRLADLVKASGYPEGAVSIVPCHVEVAQILIEDPRVRHITFTGSAKAGWAIRAKAGTKRVALELGGNAAVIVEPDADVRWAAARCALGGFTYAGQSCISTQRIYVHERVYQAFLDGLLEKVKQLRVGNVLDEQTDVGPMIASEAAERVERWIAEAVAGGAEVVLGGKRTGVFLQPTVLTHTTATMKVNCEEVFAPLVTVTPYQSLADAIEWANASPYGLQAGVFTMNLQTMFRLHAELDVGAVNGNDIPAFRVDRLPYGGAKGSGLGREGVRYAIEEMTERRVLTLKLD
jgi:glyceraldehyde-3-phosphate dehydrogenase (NADP+)